jgi:hypothetical protein
LGVILGINLGAKLGAKPGAKLGAKPGAKPSTKLDAKPDIQPNMSFGAIQSSQFMHSNKLNYDTILGANGLFCCSEPKLSSKILDIDEEKVISSGVMTPRYLL